MQRDMTLTQVEAYEAAKRAALERLKQGSYLGGGALPLRDELHERALLRSSRKSGLYLKAPQSLFDLIPRTLSQWLHKENSKLPPRCQETYWIIFDLLWPAALRQAADLKRPVDEAVNHPAGILAESLIQRLAERKPQKSDRIPIELRHYFDQIVQGESNSYVPARVILASQLHYLHAIVPEWTGRKMIPLLNWADSIEAIYLWKGYLWNPRIGPDLFQAAKGFMLQGLKHLDELGADGSNLIRLLAFMALEFPDSLTKAETLRFLRILTAKQLAEVAEALKYFLQGAGEQSSSLWRASLRSLDLVPIFRLPGKPRPINARPFAEVQDPIVILRLLAAGIGDIEDLGAQAVLTLELQEFLFEGVDVGKDLLRCHSSDLRHNYRRCAASEGVWKAAISPPSGKEGSRLAPWERWRPAGLLTPFFSPERE